MNGIDNQNPIHLPNTTIESCPALDHVVDLLTDYQRYILVTLEITITVLTVLANVMVIFTIVKTNQHKERTMNLIILISVSDLLVAVFSQPYKLRYFYYAHAGGHNSACSTHILVFFVIYFFPLFSFYIIFVVVYNNHVKLKYMDHYREQLDTIKLVSHVLYLGVLALLQSITLGIAVAINLHFLTSLLTPFELIGFLVAVTLQARSHGRMKKYQKLKEQIEQEQHDLTTTIDDLPYANRETHTLCTLYLITSAIAKSPVFISELSIYITHKTTNAQAVAVMFGYALSNCTSISNPITFIVVNKEACKTCKRFLRKCFFSKKHRRILPSPK